ncbi:MAG: [acyl-carrier-protein] S-malonyltransferase [Chloroflexota bacterium]|nr:MAG: [acyl-carrier-protein] S-malonyltransferase [Chloroflexota bacterium]
MPDPSDQGLRLGERAIALVFPGQGAQAVGMGRDLFQQFDAAREIFARADQALGFSLSRLCFEGPEDELTRTVNTQPAILTTSIAYLRVFEDVYGAPLHPRFVAGHSLGEYTALVAAGSLSFETAVRLVQERGRLMQESGERQPSGMAAVMGLDEESIHAACVEVSRDGPQMVVQIANLNGPGQIVISGTLDGLRAATDLLKSRGAKRVVPLKVSGAFHSPVMQPAADGLREAVASVEVRAAQVPLIANASASPITDADGVRTELIEQLCAPVQWHRSVECMVREGIETFVEFGPGQVLGGLIKRITKEASVESISSLDALVPR